MTTFHHRLRIAFLRAASVALLAAGTALGQGIFVNDAYDVSLAVPTGWLVADGVEADGSLAVQLQAPANAGQVILYVTPITSADRGYWQGSPDDLLADVWSGFQPHVPGAQVQRTYDARAPGRTLRALDYAGTTMAGSLLLYVGPAHAFTFVSFAAPEPQAQEIVQAGLQALLAGFGPAQPMLPDTGSATGTNPLDVGAGGNPLDVGGGGNPLDVGGGGNPLDLGGGAATTEGPGDTFVGVFVGDRVRLELAAAGDGLTGTLAVDGVTYPARAQVVGDRLDGIFEVAGTAFPFTADQDGGELSLASEGMSFALRRER